MAPVVVFGFNRPEHLVKTLQALQECPEARETEVYVKIDGPRHDEDHKKQEQIRRILEGSFNFKNLHVDWSPKNKGLANSLIAGISELVNRFGEVIVLEDDLVVSRGFLSYMNHYLNKYRNEEKVISIHGYCYPIDGLPEAFFIRGADCWGWATWKRGWDFFQPDGVRLRDELQRCGLVRKFDFDGTFPYFRMLEDQISGKVSSWAIRWNASAFLADRLTLYPGKSLVQNIGMDGSGTHSGVNQIYDSEIAQTFSPQDPALEENREAREKFKTYFRRLHPPLWKRALRKLF